MVEMMGLGIADQQGWRKGPWTPEEDKLLSEHVKLHGEGRWSSVSRCAGLKRSGKSCRLRWVNYLRPGLKRGQITPQEEAIIIELHALWGNKWSTIARYLPGRTDNEIKNYWRTHFKKKEKSSQKQEERKSQNLLKQKKLNQQQQEQTQEDNKTSDQENMNETNRAKQEVVYMNENMEDQYLPVMSHDVTSWVDYVVEDYGLWSSQLWNLDGLPFHHDHNRNCTKIAMQDEANIGGESSNIYNGGYIF